MELDAVRLGCVYGTPKRAASCLVQAVGKARCELCELCAGWLVQACVETAANGGHHALVLLPSWSQTIQNSSNCVLRWCPGATVHVGGLVRLTQQTSRTVNVHQVPAFTARENTSAGCNVTKQYAAHIRARLKSSSNQSEAHNGLEDSTRLATSAYVRHAHSKPVHS